MDAIEAYWKMLAEVYPVDLLTWKAHPEPLPLVKTQCTRDKK